MTRRLAVRAVLWDFGGVILTSPFKAFAAYERRNGLPEGLVRRINAARPDDNAWARLERGEVDIEGFRPPVRSGGPPLWDTKWTLWRCWGRFMERSDRRWRRRCARWRRATGPRA